jgi:Winged helix DNA-binding domain
VRAESAQVVLYRLAGQGLSERDGTLQAAAGGWAIQDSPPGSAALAFHARMDSLEAGALERALLEERTLVQLYNARTAAAVVPAADVLRFAGALAPSDEAGLRHLIEGAIEGDGMSAPEAEELTLAAVRDALDGRSLSRDELHAELRDRLPEPLLPWCRACQSHHARRWLLALASLRGVLCFAGRSGRQPVFARTDQWLAKAPAGADPDAAAAELVRRYLAAYGPSTPGNFCEWTGVAPAQARRAWAALEGELVQVEVDGKRSWLLEAERAALADPPGMSGVRLLPPGDPFLLARDRELLFPDAATRKRVWRPVGSPGLVVADGRLAAIWRPRKKGKRLELAVEPFGRLPKATRTGIEEEADRIAPHRGCTSSSVEFVGL